MFNKISEYREIYYDLSINPDVWKYKDEKN